jgi:hypothetical protein
MGQYIPICLAEFFAIKALAFLAFVLMAYLYWSGVKEKRAQRQERQWLEDKRRELRSKAGGKPEGQ